MTKTGDPGTASQLALFALEAFTNYDASQEPPDPDEYPTIEAYESAWSAWERKYPQLVPLVKGMSGIPTLPEHRTDVLEELPEILLLTLPEHCNQWVEKYFVSRAGTKHWYFRYCYYDRGKIHHYHIPGGNVRSQLAQRRKQAIDEAISLGRSPSEIEQLIHSWRSNV